MDPHCEVTVRCSYGNSHLPIPHHALLRLKIFFFALLGQDVGTDILAEDHDSALLLRVPEVQHFTSSQVLLIVVGIAPENLHLICVIDTWHLEQLVAFGQDFIRRLMLVEDFLRVYDAGFVLPEVTDRVPFENAAEGQAEFNRELVWRFLEVQGVLYLSTIPSALRKATVERLPACEPWHSMQGKDGSSYLQVYIIADAFPIALYRQWLFDELERSKLRVIICDNDFAFS